MCKKLIAAHKSKDFAPVFLHQSPTFPKTPLSFGPSGGSAPLLHGHLLLFLISISTLVMEPKERTILHICLYLKMQFEGSLFLGFAGVLMASRPLLDGVQCTTQPRPLVFVRRCFNGNAKDKQQLFSTP